MKTIILIFITLTLCSAQTGARYLIITHDNYYNALQPLAKWKNEKGLKTKVVRLSETGSDSTQIRAYISSAYNTWDIQPEFVLLVGNDTEIQQVRYMLPGADVFTDNYYTNVNGDFRNEIIPGRLWVYDTVHVKTIVAKILNYEMQPWCQDTLWYRRGVTIVNEDEDSFPADSVYWSDTRYAHQLMNNAGFSHIDSLAQSSGDDSMDVISAMNQGCLYMMYRGVGFYIWDWPFMGLWLNLINNGLMMPVVISATCATVEGIGYTWLYLGTPEQPRGTVGFFGTTTALYHAAEYRSALARGTLNGIFHDRQCTLGKAAEYGRQNYTDIFNDSLEYHSWTCLGDPDMRLWTIPPQPITVTHDTIFWTSTSCDTISILVQAGPSPARIDSALVCIMALRDSTIYHYGYTDNFGHIAFTDTFTTPGDSVVITVTGRNLHPYQVKIPVHFTGGPHVLLNAFSINDSAGGNYDRIANPGEDIEIPVWLKNWGDSTAYGVTATIHSAVVDSYIMLYDTVKYFADVPGMDSAYSTSDGYNIAVDAGCPDSHLVELFLEIVDADSSTWISDFSITIHAPILEFSSYHFPGNYKYTPLGDTSDLILTLFNNGSYPAHNVSGKLFSADSNLIIIDSISTFGSISSGEYATNQSDPFLLMTSNQTIPGSEIIVHSEIVSGVYVDTLTFSIYAGQRDYYVWDPDNNHSSGPQIHTILESLRYNGDYHPNILPLDDFISIYKSLFMCLGVYPDNYIVTDSSQEGPVILRYLQSFNGKIYLEGGNVWYADPHYYHGYFFYPLFEITPMTNSVGPLTEVLGEENTFTNTMNYSYTGESNSLDRIAPQGMGRMVFTKTSNGMGVGVAAYHRTVGLSFEFGGLVDSTPPSTKSILLDSIMHYFGVPPSGIQEYGPHDKPIELNLTIHPNPCRNEVRIAYCLGRNAQEVSLHMYDVSGRLVKSFSLPTAHYLLPTVLTWDGTDMLNRKLPQGIYFISVSSNEQSLTQKIIFLR